MATIPAQPSDVPSSLSQSHAQAAEKRAAIPWYIWCATLAVTSATVGGYWDISWHESIGRDTFWTPAHMAIQLCGVLAGIAFGYLILHTTFSKNSPLAPASVHIFGFRAPMGAFIASWGGIAMLTSAPFDNWWHDAYGIDVKIVSPPHILLIMGVYGVVIGTLVLLAGHMNRSQSTSHSTEHRLILYINGIMLVQIMILLMEVTERPYLHRVNAYLAVAALPPIVLALSSRLTGYRFAATLVTAFYTLFRVGLILVLPLFPAEPKLGPVYQKVTHFIPPDFPLLFIVPAFALDLLWQRTKTWNPWKLAALSSAIWVAVFLAVEWPFASFLMSPASRNWFFGTNYFFYAMPPTSFMARHTFYPSGPPILFSFGMLAAVLIGTLAFRWGLTRGEWLGKDQTVKLVRFAAFLLWFAALAQAHVGSPDIFLEGSAGPYQLFVTVRPPLTIPGVAEIEVRSESPGVRGIKAVPLAITGAGSKYAPIPDALKASPQDPQFFTGALWMMTSGSWQARLTVDGAQGEGTLSVPVPSFARASKKMQWGLGLILSVVGIFLVSGLIAIIGAASREAKLDPGQPPTPANLRSGRKATIIGAVVVLAVVFGGNAWWNNEANDYNERIYKPLQMSASLNGGELSLQMNEPGWMQVVTLQQAAFRVFTRKMDDLVPDHGHIMHLYAIRQPGLDVVYHLHPEQRENGSFLLPLPSMAAGHYKLYADIVHANGFPETMLTEIDLPALHSRPLAGDDASASTDPWQKSSTTSNIFTLPDGYKMEWLRGPKPLRASEATSFTFRLTKPDDSVPPDMALYMGMVGHAAFVKTDGSVFAHIHPNGSVSMAALMLAQGMPAEMQMDEGISNTVSFPYGFPTPGRYRIFVQMKHGSTVETGVFDATADPPPNRKL